MLGAAGAALGVLGVWVRIFGGSARRLAPGSLLAVEGEGGAVPRTQALPSSALPACSIPAKLRSVPCGLRPGGEGIGLASGGGIRV